MTPELRLFLKKDLIKEFGSKEWAHMIDESRAEVVMLKFERWFQ